MPRAQRLPHASDRVAIFGVQQRHGADMGAARDVDLLVVHHQRVLVGHEMLEGDPVGLHDDFHLVEYLFRPRDHHHVEAVVGGCLLEFAPPVLLGARHRLPRIGNEKNHHGGLPKSAALVPHLKSSADTLPMNDSSRWMCGSMPPGIMSQPPRRRSRCRPAARSQGNGGDGLAFDQDVGAAGVIVIDCGAAADQDGHGACEHVILKGANRYSGSPRLDYCKKCAMQSSKRSRKIDAENRAGIVRQPPAA